eukprot:COSAG02_NODE_39179_length_420_cov_0.797508_1_plen_33_part_10
MARTASFELPDMVTALARVDTPPSEHTRQPPPR